MQMRPAAAVLVGVIAVACHVPGTELAGRASDEWVRSYTLAPGGEIAVSSTNGAIEVEGYDGSTVEVRAERTARAISDESARELVSRITIQEEVTPERVAIRTEGISGLLLGVSYQVTYHVRAPHSVVARLRTTNGAILVKRFDGHLVAASTNGGVIGEELGGSLEARGTNGQVRVGFTAVGTQGITIRTTNGRVDLALPAAVKAHLSANCRNGSIAVDGLPFEPVGEQTRREVRGTINGGGPPIDLTTTNGGIRIRGASSEL
jgi:hypothetical protein